ncbi:MAG: SPOR domain-containing protein [Treponema sp.]|nr:SPOR domain-containing protein [Treponema sp.]
MEKRKLLLVAISAGIFLVIAIGSAIVFTPQETTVASRAVTVYPSVGGTAINVTPPTANAFRQAPVPEPAAPGPASVDPVGLVRGPVDTIGLQPPPQGAIQHGGEFVVTGATQGGQAAQTVVVPRPTTAPAVPVTPPARTVTPAPAPRPAPAVTPRPAPAAPQPAPAAPRPAPAVTAAPRPAPPAAQARVPNDYWVQAGSFSTIANAERAKEALAHRGITSIIENRVVGNENRFRVRVGPYTSQNEADHWLYLVRAIDGFETSMVWQTVRR